MKGRPKKYSPEVRRLAVAQFKEGANPVYICRQTGMVPSTLYAILAEENVDIKALKRKWKNQAPDAPRINRPPAEYSNTNSYGPYLAK